MANGFDVLLPLLLVDVEDPRPAELVLHLGPRLRYVVEPEPEPESEGALEGRPPLGDTDDVEGVLDLRQVEQHPDPLGPLQYQRVKADGHVLVPEPVVDHTNELSVLLGGDYDVGVLEPVLLPRQDLRVGPDPHQVIEVLVVLFVDEGFRDWRMAGASFFSAGLMTMGSPLFRVYIFGTNGF